MVVAVFLMKWKLTSSPLSAMTDTGLLLGVLGCLRGMSKWGVVSSTPSRGLNTKTKHSQYNTYTGLTLD